MIRASLLASVVLVAVPRSAKACGQGGANYAGLATLLAVVAVTGATDAGLTLWDGGSALVSHRPSQAYGVFELVVAGPQLLLAGVGLVDSIQRPYSSNGTFFGVYTGWMALLVAHGVWSVASAEAMPQQGTDAFHAQRASTGPPQPQIALGMTYAPVGQLAHPGLGVIGRF